MSSSLERCLALLSSHTGLVFDRREQVEARIQTRIVELGLDNEAAYLHHLSSPDRMRDEVQALASTITIRETYFFRDQDQLSAMVGWILSRAHAERGEPVMIWSAGCSTGEEPYSLAILLEESRTLSPVLEYKIVGTDLDEAALEHARKGCYSGRTLRHVPPELQDRYFEPGPKERRLMDRVRSRVSFVPANLVKDQPPFADRRATMFDLIVCRNVLIYFSDVATEDVIDRMRAVLKPGGALFLGHTEGFRFAMRYFDVVKFEGSHAYVHRVRTVQPAPATSRRHSKRTGRGRDRIREPGIEQAKRERPHPLRPWVGNQRAPTQPQTPSTSPSESLSLLDDILERAWLALSLGQHEEVETLCAAVLDLDPLRARAHRMLATSRLDRGLPDQARDSLSRLIYLDPGDVGARFSMARCLDKLGDGAGGDREYRNVLEAIQTLDPNSEVPEGDGRQAEGAVGNVHSCGRGGRIDARSPDPSSRAAPLDSLAWARAGPGGSGFNGGSSGGYRE